MTDNAAPRPEPESPPMPALINASAGSAETARDIVKHDQRIHIKELPPHQIAGGR